MSDQSFTVVRTKLAPARRTWLMAAAAALLLLMMLAALVTMEASVFSNGMAATLALVQEPLIDGPLVDMGNVLSDNQLGQFQQ